ncbi:MAG TPA: hypothetical protein GXZ24_07780, partial [Firmicutes bacterium]|nr:hypothetical protein [Bacillota bacterium]
FAGRDVYYLVDVNINIYYLLGLLNSKLIKFWLEHRGKKKGEVFEIYPEPIKNIPIKYSNNIFVENVISNTKKIISFVYDEQKYYGNSRAIEIDKLEKEINHSIGCIYNLTNSEIAFIEGHN